MTHRKPAQIVAECELALDGKSAIAVRIMKPELDDDGSTYVCRYEIGGLQHPGPGRAYGADGVQALLLALHMIAVVLETSAEAKAGRLGPLDRFGSLGFRYPDDVHARTSHGH
jgi:hypothetical protein